MVRPELATTSWGNPGEEDGLVQRPAAPLVSMQNAHLNTWSSCASSAAVPGVPGSSPKPSRSFKPAKPEDEKDDMHPAGLVTG
jgi:hypothetical protein